VPISTRYFDEASSINFWRSVEYGLGIINVLLRYALHNSKIILIKQFTPKANPKTNS
jgi:hypothetical protein